DKQGQKRYISEVVADNVYFTGERKEGSSQSPNNDFAQRPATFAPPQSESFQEPAKGTGFSVGDFEEIDTDDSELPF
ncbi:MAG: single-stranded DNA-binding protein, partial [Oscillospiraceae bacterium]